jgi:hypothetical protein
MIEVRSCRALSNKGAGVNFLGRNLIKGTIDPFVEVTLKDQKFKTKVVDNEVSPVFNQRFTFTVSDVGTEEVHFKIFDQVSVITLASVNHYLLCICYVCIKHSLFLPSFLALPDQAIGADHPLGDVVLALDSFETRPEQVIDQPVSNGCGTIQLFVQYRRLLSVRPGR